MRQRGLRPWLSKAKYAQELKAGASRHVAERIATIKQEKASIDV
jgi:hypothetical protein